MSSVKQKVQLVASSLRTDMWRFTFEVTCHHDIASPSSTLYVCVCNIYPSLCVEVGKKDWYEGAQSVLFSTYNSEIGISNLSLRSYTKISKVLYTVISSS